MPMPSRPLARLVPVALAAWLGVSPTAGACPLPLPELHASVAGHALTAELAVTPEAQQCGLSRRDRLAPDHGMLFVFPHPVHIAFWMKDTRIPLSIAFLDDQRRILAIARMAPLDTDSRHHPGGPYRYALEMPQGWFERQGVGPGDRVDFALPATP